MTTTKTKKPVPPPLIEINPYWELIILADQLDDIEKARLAQENRLRTLVGRDNYSKHQTLESVQLLVDLLNVLKALEADYIKALTRAIDRSPWADFAKRTRGLGQKTLGRLLGAIGDPYWNTLYDRPRTLNELYAYCGLHITADNKAPRKARGERVNWSPTARMRVYNCYSPIFQATQRIVFTCPEHPEGCPVLKECEAGQAAKAVATKPFDADNRLASGPYAARYNNARRHYAQAVHTQPCATCKAQAGEPLSDSHQHGRAERVAMKLFVRDLWREARLIHQTSLGRNPNTAAPEGLLTSGTPQGDLVA